MNLATPRNRIRAAWNTLQGRPTIAFVSSTTITFPPITFTTKRGILIIGCSNLMISGDLQPPAQTPASEESHP